MKKLFAGLLLAVLSLSAFAQATLSTRDYPLYTTFNALGMPIAIQGASTNQTVLSSAPGTTTNDAACTGCVGEVLSATVASGSAVPLTSTTVSYNVANVPLTAGDYDCRGQAEFVTSAATTTVYKTGLSLTSATLPSQAGGSGLGYEPLKTGYIALTTTSATISQDVAPVRISLSTTGTAYLVSNLTFTAGSATAYGSATCRRVR